MRRRAAPKRSAQTANSTAALDSGVTPGVTCVIAMTDNADLYKIELDAQRHLDRCRGLEARLTNLKGAREPSTSIVPRLCQTILTLTRELRELRELTSFRRRT